MKTNRRAMEHNTKPWLCALSALFIAGLTAVGNTNAQAVVTDPMHTGLTQFGWVKELVAQGQQYAKQMQQYQTQINQYKAQIKQYEQQYVKGGVFNQGAMRTTEFARRPLDAGLSSRCPSALRTLISGNDAAEKCALIVQTENARYNAIIDVLDQSEDRESELQEIYRERAGIKQEEQGALLANQQRLTSFIARMDHDMQLARSQTEGFDTLLSLLREDLKTVTQTKLDGDGGGIGGGVVRGAALKVALRGARRSDR